MLQPIALIGSAPAIAYCDGSAGLGTGSLYYLTASSIDGEEWRQPDLVQSGLGLNGGYPSLLNMSGKPR
jgi:hypothetical protein